MIVNSKPIRKNNIIGNDTFIKIRCTSKDKNKIKNKADKLNITLSEYILNSSLAGTEKKSVKKKREIKKLIERTELMKDIYQILEDTTENTETVKVPIKLLNRILNTEEELWEF